MWTGETFFRTLAGERVEKQACPSSPSLGHPAAPLSRLSYSGKVRKSSAAAKGNSGFFFRALQCLEKLERGPVLVP